MEDDTVGNSAIEAIEARYKIEGVDSRFVGEPFLEASELGDSNILRQRLAAMSTEERRSLVRSVDQHGRSGLLLAAERGQLDVAQVLLEASANPNDSDSSGTTAMHFAACRGSASILQLLLEFRADAERTDDRGNNPLMWAAGARAVNVLLDARVDAGSHDLRGRSALMHASARGDLDAVETLAKVSGIDVNDKDVDGTSAHAIAAAAGCWDVADLLIRLGAVASAESQGRDQPARVLLCIEALHEAARRGDAVACTELLQSAALEVDAQVAGETALLLAAGANRGAAVEVLLQARADPNQSDSFLKESPLARAVLGGCDCELLWLLLEARADPKQADLNGRTPVEVAEAWGHCRGAEILKAATAGQLDLGGMD